MTDRTGDYANECAKDYLQVDTSEGKKLFRNSFMLRDMKNIFAFEWLFIFLYLFFVPGFCRNALVSIVAEFNEGAFDCDCKPPGALG